MPVGIRHNSLIDAPLTLLDNIKGGREALPVSSGMLGGDGKACVIANQEITATQMLAAFESEIASGRCRNIGYSRRALSSLCKSVADGRTTFGKALLLHWHDDMRAKGLRASTIRGYLEAMQALYRRVVPGGTLFRDVRVAIAPITYYEETPAPAVSVDALRRAALREEKMPAALRLALDIFLFNVYNGGIFSTVDLVDMRASDCLDMPQQARDIAAAYAAPRRKYVFPLAQGRRTSASIARTTTPLIVSALHIAGIYRDAVADIARIASACWRTAAKQAGTAAAAPTPETLRAVADNILDTRPHWYAMRLRQRVHPDDVTARLSHSPITVDTYYPCREIVRRSNAGMQTHNEAFIAGVLFFRTRPQALAPLFRLIGDIAWGYRTTSAADAPYASIPDADMLIFQRMVCVFTPDMTIGPLRDHSTLQPGRRVRITGGVMAGYEGTIHDVPHGDGASSLTRIFRLRISHDFGFEWTVQVPEALIQPL